MSNTTVFRCSGCLRLLAGVPSGDARVLCARCAAVAAQLDRAARPTVAPTSGLVGRWVHVESGERVEVLACHHAPYAADLAGDFWELLYLDATGRVGSSAYRTPLDPEDHELTLCRGADCPRCQPITEEATP